jgi:TonB family protein
MLAAVTSEGAINAAPRGADRKPHGRLTLFCGGSILLHVLALAVNPPGGAGIGGSSDGAPGVMHAVLSPLYQALDTNAAEATLEPLPDSAPAAPAGHVRQGTAQEGGRPASTHAITATPFPVPDYWFSVDELSVRAEPLTDVQIPYPAELADRRVVGLVKLLLHIDEQGFVRRTLVEESIPEGAFDRAALAAWADVRFSPAMKDGVAVKSRKLLEISFLP